MRGTPTWGLAGVSRSLGCDAPPHPLGLHLLHRRGLVHAKEEPGGPAPSVEPLWAALGLQRAPWSRPPFGTSAAFSVTPGESGLFLRRDHTLPRAGSVKGGGREAGTLAIRISGKCVARGGHTHRGLTLALPLVTG